MKNKFLVRIILDVILFGSAMMGAWWIVFPVGLICVWYFRRFFEFPLSALVFDSVYGASRDQFFGYEYIYSTIAALLFFAIIFFKSKVRKDLWQKTF